MQEDAKIAYPQMLTLAGFDPLGGAGVTADHLVAADFGVHAHAIPTCLVVQNTHGVFGASATEHSGFDDALGALRDDLVFGAVKVGVVATSEIARSIAEFLSTSTSSTSVVVDPILTGGARRRTQIVDVLGPEYIALYRQASLLTPNTEELEKLGASLGVERTIQDSEWIQAIADSLGAALLVTGGHTDKPGLDRLYEPGESEHVEFAAEVELPGIDVHGTGCHFSTAIAALTGRGVPMRKAIGAAKRYMEHLLQHCIWSPGDGRPQILHDDKTRSFGCALVSDHK